MNKQGRNVYVGMALRQGETGPSGRATKDNVVTGSRGWGDFDKEGDDVRVQTALKQKGLEAAEMILTGSIPHRRFQIFFELARRAVTPEELEAVNAAIRDGLGGNGDGVQNCDRIMRLAGTVSYPPPNKVERGYVPELTRLVSQGKARAPIRSTSCSGCSRTSQPGGRRAGHRPRASATRKRRHRSGRPATTTRRSGAR